MIVSVCGQECDQCNFFPEDCAGCPEMSGKPFWAKGLPDNICGIYRCVEKKELGNCGQCDEIPCDQYQSVKDPAASDEAHRKNILDRVNRLKTGKQLPETNLLEEWNEDRVEKAVNAFNSGMNCSQAILTSYSERLGLDKGTAMRIAGGFGAGMARMQETCGAVTGAVMVIGLKMIDRNTGPDGLRGKVYDTIQEFFKRFRDLNGTTECADLLNCDLRTPEGQKTFKDNNLSSMICAKCVKDAASILEELLNMD